MAILNIFKKRKKIEENVKKEEKVEKKIKPKARPKEVKVEKPSEAVTPKVKKEVKVGEAWKLLKSPHVTEKAADLTKKNQYIFKVFPKANKVQIKKAIEALYGINVISVKIINVSPKKRKLGKISGWRKRYKKAIIKIKEGQKIEVLPR